MRIYMEIDVNKIIQVKWLLKNRPTHKYRYATWQNTTTWQKYSYLSRLQLEPLE